MTFCRLILLGTKGGPRLTTGSSWPSSSVLMVEGKAYIVDAGLGVTRQFVEAGFTLAEINKIFITHNHSDHVLELGPLLHTIWTSSPKRQVPVYGPQPLSRSVELFFKSMSYDISVRMKDEKQADPRGMFPCNEFEEGLVMKDDLLSVSALRVKHPPVTECFALKFEIEGKIIVFSSDTTYFPPLIKFASGADVLIHEVMHREGTIRMCERLKSIKPNLWSHMVASHTFGEDVGKIAKMAGVKHLVLNHFTPSDDPEIGPKDFESIVRKTWDGPLTVGHDLAEIKF